MRVGERYHYTQSGYDCIVEILEVISQKEFIVYVIQSSGRTLSLGKQKYAWQLTAGIWEYLEGQDKPI